MKRTIKFQYLYIVLVLFLSISGCSIDRKPLTNFTNANYWNTESDLKEACNRLYQQLPGYVTDNRADDSYGPGPDQISEGSRQIPNTSSDWTNPYQMIFTANNILEQGLKVQADASIKNRYFAEARFFRAYAYFTLVKEYGDVPLLLKTITADDQQDLDMPRTPRAEVIDTIYADLDFAAQWLPLAGALSSADYGRVSKGAALAFEARVGLYEGTYAKFHNNGEDINANLQIAVNAALSVMQENYYSLNLSYSDMFLHEGDGPSNKENVFVKVYGSDAIVDGTYTNPIVTNNNSRNMANGAFAPTRNLVEQYLCTDGLPYGVSPLTAPDTSYNSIFINRDPRLGMTIFKKGEEAYKGPWVPYSAVPNGTATAYAQKKGFDLQDWNNNKSTIDKALIRYAEVLLTYAEAKFELNGSISDADLNMSINQIRDRVGVGMPHLTNAFVTNNHLDMRTEIRRERTIELAMEGFRYDDIIRWKTAETVLPVDILGAKFFANDWTTTSDPSTLNLTADSILIVEPASKRVFNPQKDYLYPVPLHEITFSNNNVTQNPGWVQ